MAGNTRFVLRVAILAIVATVAYGQEAAYKTAPQQARSASTSQSTQTTDSDQRAATRRDLETMRAILNQMRTNLAFVGSTTTPLNHQFELDIEMWQALVNQMERRVEPPADKNTDQR